VARKKTELSPERQAVGIILSEKVLPNYQRHGVSRIVLGTTSLRAQDIPEGMSLSKRAFTITGTKKRGKDPNVLAAWPDEDMEALRFPILCFVYSGEADIRIGDFVVHCPAGHGILIPAGVPHSSHAHGYWLRPNRENATSDILWINFNAGAAVCHYSHTRAGKHHSDYGWYSVVGDRSILALSESLIAELEQKSSRHQEVANAFLLLILNLVLRDFISVQSKISESQRTSIQENQSASHPELIVDRAQSYINNHLSHHITLQEIAHAAYVSRAHLAQVFKAQLGCTVWDYVIERRIQEAKTLLVETDMVIRRIAYLSGFASPSTFSARFTKITGVSPTEYRRISKQNSIKN
jgi:AraC-like DNA-binding protein